MYNQSKMKFLIVATVVVMASFSGAQRPYYAGRRPIGYPELGNRFITEETANAATTNTTGDGLANRLGEDGQPLPTTTTTTQRLPVDALGDRELVDRISRWPVDKQPYWYLNWKQIEAHRQNPVSSGIPNTRPSFVRPLNNNNNRQAQAFQ